MTDSEMITAVAECIGLHLYEHRGDFYKHPVDDRDACASWNPLRHTEDAMELLASQQLDVIWSKGYVTVRTASNLFTEETKMAVLLRTIVEALIYD